MKARPRRGPRFICPVCHRPIVRTGHHRISGHYDLAGARDKHLRVPRSPCPGSFEPFDIAIAITFAPWEDAIA